MTTPGRHRVSSANEHTSEDGDWVDLTMEIEPVICEFGHTGSKVEACERDALEGEHYCAVHYDALYG